MNYRHAFHAGNFADVFKHIMLLDILNLMKKKDTPFAIIDTHAGEGLYSLQNKYSKTNEAQEGILKLIAAKKNWPSTIQNYLDALNTITKNKSSQLYPGSPLLMASSLRSKDRLIAFETEEDAVDTLKKTLASIKQTKVIAKDGYSAVESHLPFPEKSGLIFIDPPFEDGEDFNKIIHFIKKATKKYRQAVFVIWFAIKSLPMIHLFYDELAGIVNNDVISVEFFKHQPIDPLKFNGSGMIIINPPHTFDNSLEEWMPVLVKAIGEKDSSWQKIILR